MNFNEDEAVIVTNFDPGQVWRPIAVSTRSKTQGLDAQQQVDKVSRADKGQLPIDKKSQQMDKGK